MYIVAATMKAQPGKEAEIEQLLRGLVAPSRAETGTLTYNFHRGARDPQLFFFYEQYRDRDAFKTHATSELLTKAFEQLTPLLAEPPQVVHLAPIDVAPPKSG